MILKRYAFFSPFCLAVERAAMGVFWSQSGGNKRRKWRVVDAACESQVLNNFCPKGRKERRSAIFDFSTAIWLAV